MRYGFIITIPKASKPAGSGVIQIRLHPRSSKHSGQQGKWCLLCFGMLTVLFVFLWERENKHSLLLWSNQMNLSPPTEPNNVDGYPKGLWSFMMSVHTVHRWQVMVFMNKGTAHPTHSPDLCLCHFHLFGSLKEHLGGQWFNTIRSQKAVQSW
jgi:hypothetical protein